MQVLAELRELLHAGVRRADNAVVHRPQCVIAHVPPTRVGAHRRTAHLHLQGLARLVAGRVVMLVGPPRPVMHRPHALATQLDGLLRSIGDQGLQHIPEMLRPGVVIHMWIEMEITSWRSQP